jgi:hypothetical protein
MTNRFDDEADHQNAAKPDTQPPEVDADDRSDANDGVERPLGYYSSQAQADRSKGLAGSTPTNEAADGPGFYSPEQQASRNAPTDLGVVRTETYATYTQTPAQHADWVEETEKRDGYLHRKDDGVS